MKKIGFVICIVLLALVTTAAQDNQILNLREQIVEIQNQGRLGFGTFVLCSSIFTYASYVPLSEPAVGKTGTLLLYYEPRNIYTKKNGPGAYEIWYSQDLAILKGDGTLISEWTDFLEFHHRGNKPAIDVFAQNSLEFDGSFPAGKYKLKAVLKDHLRGESVSKTIDFEIR